LWKNRIVDRKVEEGKGNEQINTAFIQYEGTCGRVLRLTVGGFGNKRISGILKTRLSETLYKDALIVIQTGGQHSHKYLK
jgi:hypothetical protein